MKVIIQSMKKPLLYFASCLLLGIIIGSFVLNPENNASAEIVNLSQNRTELFFYIVKTNCIAILAVYISVVFSRKYAVYVYCINGIILGVTLGWIFASKRSLILLIVPHGLFEIIDILATGYIVEKGEHFIRDHFGLYLKALFLNELFTVICAGIEAYITPCFFTIIG